MYKHQYSGWSKKATSYSHHFGVLKKSRSVLRYIIPAAVIVNAAILVAVVQAGHKFDDALRDDSNHQQLAKVEKIPEPVKTPQALATAATPPEQVLTQDPQLQSVLDNWVKTHPSKDWSIVVQGLDLDSRSASVRGKSWYTPASIYKLLMTQTVFQNYDLKDLQTQTITVDGKKRTMSSCLDAMIRVSDNPCGEAMGKFFGWSRIDANLRKLGLKETQLNGKDAQFINAEDTALYLRKLYNGDAMASDERDWLLNVMQQQKFRKGIPAGCADCVVADKIGDLMNVRHDAAIVKHGSHAYVLVIFTSGAGYDQMAELTRQIQSVMVNVP